MKFPVYDQRVEKALEKAPYNKNSAADVLLLTAEYLEENKEMPPELRYFLVDAFKSAMQTSVKFCGQKLLRKLNLLDEVGRHPSIPLSPTEFKELFLLTRHKCSSDTATAKRLEVDSVLNWNKRISASTIGRYWQQLKAEEQRLEDEEFEEHKAELISYQNKQ